MLNNEMQHFVIEMCQFTILILLVSSFKSHFEALASFFWVGTKECALGSHSIEKNKLIGSLSLIPLNKPRENQLTIINVISNAWTLTTFTIIPLSYHI